ncbi:hypothetical protein FA227_24750 [Pseudomonas aeruginosa]|nr:hypothetical protein B7D75_14700 [Pseudomonas paraeruginosa]KAB0744187.1 hypothetical protein F7O94_18495 [Pseudomonas aeruginosa]MCO3058431.1 hypothetical protein [Pseudomonas aeruginosa]MCO3131557.1 hypothetical protein [Pseudomonas aeruginosa]MCO3161839.1 hypothetical protein [Pseudomonas aeruginosa]
MYVGPCAKAPIAHALSLAFDHPAFTPRVLEASLAVSSTSAQPAQVDGAGQPGPADNREAIVRPTALPVHPFRPLG